MTPTTAQPRPLYRPVLAPVLVESEEDDDEDEPDDELLLLLELVEEVEEVLVLLLLLPPSTASQISETTFLVPIKMKKHLPIRVVFFLSFSFSFRVSWMTPEAKGETYC